MSFIKTAAAVVVIGFACSGTIASAQNADVGTSRAASTAASGQQGPRSEGTMTKGNGMTKSDGMTGRSSSNGAEPLGTGNDRTTSTGGNAGGRADKN